MLVNVGKPMGRQIVHVLFSGQSFMLKRWILFSGMRAIIMLGIMWCSNLYRYGNCDNYSRECWEGLIHREARHSFVFPVT